MTDIVKEDVRRDLIAHLLGGESATDDAIGVHAVAAEWVDDEASSVDDISQRDAAGDLHALMQEHDDQQQALVAKARALDMTATETVRPGAIIGLDGAHYIVGVASDEFTSGALTYAGISVDAPLYGRLEGAKARDTIAFNGHSSTIDYVA